MIPINSKPALIDQVFEQIKQAIITGDLLPSAPLAQEALAAELGVSRQPVSHALMLLEKDGLVVEKGKKGRMVAPIDRHKLRRLYQMRAVLDGLAASLCADRTDNTLSHRLQAGLKRGYAAAETRDICQMVAADSIFHQTIYDCSGNSEIFGALAGGWPHMLRAMHIVLSAHARPQQIWDEHAQIVEAICAGRGEQARNAAITHAETSGQTTFENIAEELGENIAEGRGRTA